MTILVQPSRRVAVGPARPAWRALGFTPAQGRLFLLLLLLLAVAPLVGYPVLLMKLLCMGLFACSFNLLGGHAGLISFGHAAYFGLGAYFTAWLATAGGLSPELAVGAGALGTAAIGALFGWVAIRRPGMFFPMITLAAGQMVYFFCLQAPFTNGEDGIQRVPRGALFGLLSLEHNLTLYWVVATVFVAGFLLMHRVVRSPFGQVLRAVRDSPARATSLGYECGHYQLIVCVLAAAMAGVAGGMKTIVFGIATLGDVGFATSGDALLMTLVGGLGTVFGPLVGAVVVGAMDHLLAPVGAWLGVAQGAVFVLCVLVFRGGLLGELGRKFNTAL